MDDFYVEITRARALLWAAKLTEDAWDRETFLSMLDEVLQSIEGRVTSEAAA